MESGRITARARATRAWVKALAKQRLKPAWRAQEANDWDSQFIVPRSLQTPSLSLTAPHFPPPDPPRYARGMRKTRKLRAEAGIGFTLVAACIPALVTGSLFLMLLSDSP